MITPCFTSNPRSAWKNRLECIVVVFSGDVRESFFWFWFQTNLTWKKRSVPEKHALAGTCSNFCYY
jgi:hypothetical protein